MAVGAEVFSGKVLAICLGDKPYQLLVAELVELLRRDGFTDSGFEGFHDGVEWLEWILNQRGPGMACSIGESGSFRRGGGPNSVSVALYMGKAGAL